jgi:hypothetical protein
LVTLAQQAQPYAPDDPENSCSQEDKMRIPVLGSTFLNESLLIIIGIVLGIAAGGTAVATVLDNGPVKPQLTDGMIQAQATIDGAWIQGTMTLSAGFAAIVAAGIAYKVSIRQVRHSESQHNARVLAYTIKLKLAIEDLMSQAISRYKLDKEALDHYRNGNGNYYLELKPFAEPMEFSDNEWEYHALLGEQVVRKLNHCRKELSRIILLKQKVFSEYPEIDIANAKEDDIKYKVIKIYSDHLRNIARKYSKDFEKPLEENIKISIKLLRMVDDLIITIDNEHKLLEYDLEKLYVNLDTAN